MGTSSTAARVALVVVACWAAGATAQAGILDPGGQPDPTFDGNAMLLWLKADAGFSPGATATWADQSTHGYLASQTNAAYQPTYNGTALNGSPAVLFDGDDYLTIATGPTGQQTAFFVYTDTSTGAYRTPLGTTYDGKGSYHGHSNDSKLFSSTYTDPKTVGGLNYRNGASVGDGLSTPRPDDWALDVHVATGPLAQAVSTVGADNHLPASRAIDGGIAEILVYDRALNANEINDVGYYLEQKYGLATAYGPSAPGLVSYWTFDDGTANDTVGGNHATFGTKAGPVSPGIIGDAADLDGQPGNQFDANITVPAGHSLNTQTAATNQATFEAWLQPDDIHTNTYTEVMRQDNPGYEFLSFQGHGTAFRFHLQGSNLDVTGLDPADFEDGAWHHIAGTYDGVTQRLYFDGQEVASKPAAIALSGASPPAFVMGNLNLGSSYSEAFDGRMDEIAVWQTALSADEIKHHWINRLPYTTQLEVVNPLVWNLHDDWDPADGTPGDPPQRAWYYQRRSAGQYSDLTDWGRNSWWQGGNAWRGPGTYPVVGCRIGEFDHLESTVDAYIAAHGLDQMDLLLMHPSSSEEAVVTWRNPLPGTNIFEFEGVFWHIDDTGTNGVEVSISASDAFGLDDALLADILTGLGGDTVLLNSASGSLPDSAAFLFRLTMDYGEELHFRVGANGSHGSDASMLGLQVTWVPEPCTLVLLAGGLGVLRARRRRR